MITIMIKIERKLHKLDATGKAVGRLASQIALILRGKNKAEYLPHIDGGDMVLVSNIDKFKFTGKKIEQKVYQHYSGYQGGLKTKKISEMKPEQILREAVRDMLPKTKHRINMLRRLIIAIPGAAHKADKAK
ncbi:MAG: 50S ribosomal protein L13 [bacterium]|nr:50S ribosomal protein L13 [bacterium]